MEGIGSLKVLNVDQENYKLAAQLPKRASVRWGRRVNEWKAQNRSFPPFSEFVKYLVSESNIACNHVNICKFNKGDDFKKMKRSPLNVKNDQTREEHRPGNTLLAGSQENDQSTCVLCNGQHDLDSCREFCSKDIKDKKEYAKVKGLCFGCLEVGHVSKSCRKRKTCATYGKAHPTSFHCDVRKTETKNSTPP